MNRAEALTHFHERYLNPMLIEKIEEANHYFIENKTRLSETFLENFKQICKYIVSQQEQEKGRPIHSINLSLLRTSLNEGNAFCRWDVFDDAGRWEWETEYQTYDITWAAHYLSEIIETLEPERKKYLFNLIGHDLAGIKQTYIENFFVYIRQLMYNVLRWYDLTNIPEFQAIEKCFPFSIHVGEFLDTYKPIYMDSGPSQVIPNMKNRLKRKPCQCFQTLKNINVTDREYANINFSCSDVSGGNFKGSKMSGGMYVNTRMKESNCVGSDFSNSNIFDADFRDSSLAQANFSGVKGGRRLGLDILNIPQMLKGCTQEDAEIESDGIPSFLGVSFYRSDLTQTNFTEADLRFGDFRKAIFHNTIFTGCLLDGAIFLEKDRTSLQLTPEQIAEIDWVEE
ncbi:pentapeptide repeat-containing protein [Anaerosinus massiliensis]|uniref:pentapeptide repeat-containing protein n=1 Tax=Massilibacillus massiliensis TaxID=1806837 RepID=UPI000DA6176D|nr:pentapeptide repeat-containing protein [Massilibacillus massiliensis]